MERKKKKLRIYALSIFLLFGNNWVYYKCTQWLYIPNSNKENQIYDYTIVLGGILEQDEQHQQINFNNNADRWLHACFNDHVKSDTIIFTSGSGKLSRPKEKEALLLKRFWKEDKRFKFESNSRNTHENATFSKEFILKKDAKVLLITSASHMRRAKACFTKQGLNVDVFSVDYDNPGNFTFQDYLLPQAKVFYFWEGTLHEYLGILSYKFKGYID